MRGLVPVMRFKDQSDHSMGERQAEQAPVGEGRQHVAQAIGTACLSDASVLQQPGGDDAGDQNDTAQRRKVRKAPGDDRG